MSSILDSFGDGKKKPINLASGEITRIDVDGVFVKVPAFNRTHDFGPIEFEHADSALVGDSVLVGFDEQGTAWVAAWSGSAGGGVDPTAMHSGDAAGGVLSGTYPDPGFAVDMATQAELDTEATARALVATNLSTHAALTTSAHGGIVASTDSRLTDARVPTAHAASHGSVGSDPVTIAQSQVTNLVSDLALKAPLASPTLTGTPAAPTAGAGTNTTQIATTAFVTTADNLKANLASPTFTGTPAAPTAAADTNTTQIATTAFVLGQAGAGAPAMDGSASAGTSGRWSRQDHVHPTDTSRAPLASPTFTGDPKAPTPAAGDNDTSIATTAFVQSLIASGRYTLKQIDVLTNTAATTYSVPADAAALYIECIGGGGGGGAAAATAAGQVALGGGGGGAAYASKFLTSNLNAGGTLAIVVGAGAAASGGAGSAGTDTSFKDSASTTVCLAKGGSGGGVGSPAASPPILMGVAGVGGAASGCVGDTKLDGGDGGWGFATTSGNGLSGEGGAAAQGAAQGRRGAIAGAGVTGRQYGGGGTGGGAANGSASVAGGAGGQGMIRVWVFMASTSGGGPSITVGTTPPASPADGDRWIYTGSGFDWEFIYDSTETTYKWKFLGGGALVATVATQETFTDDGGFHDPTTAGPTVTLPRAGDYNITASAHLFYSSQAAVQGCGFGATASSGTWDATAATGSIIMFGAETSAGRGVGGAGHGATLRGVSAGATIKEVYYAGADTGTPNVRWRQIQATPIRVI